MSRHAADSLATLCASAVFFACTKANILGLEWRIFAHLGPNPRATAIIGDLPVNTLAETLGSLPRFIKQNSITGATYSRMTTALVIE
ncbi:MAG TPA: hypothetical protein VNZ94_12315 [Xanthobacteraceae bacterium]|nr:hypothetical protein [Xanthobacteraceae bacterium]